MSLHDRSAYREPEHPSHLTSMAIIECIPNVSEGRRPEVVERDRRAPSVACPASGCSTIRPTPSHNRSVFTLAGDAAPLDDRRARAVRAGARRHRPAHAPGRASPPRRRRRRPLRADRRRHDGRLRRARRRRRRGRSPSASGCRCTSTRRRRRNPARKNLEDIRRGEFEGLAAKMATPGWAPDFGPASAAPVRRRVRHRRAHAAHRLQHQPRDRSARRRQEDRRGDPPQQRRLPVRQGHRLHARGSRHRAGVDEPDQLSRRRRSSGCSSSSSARPRATASRCSRARSSGWFRRPRSSARPSTILQLERFSGRSGAREQAES